MLFGLTALGAGSPGAIGDDLQELWRAVRDGEPEKPRVHLFATRRRVSRDAHQRRQAIFPDVSPMGGRIWGVPQIAAKAAEEHLILVDAGALAVSDLGLTIDSTRTAAIQLNDAATRARKILSAHFRRTADF